MKPLHRFLAIVAVAAPAALLAQDELFDFIPDGGRTLLGQLIEGGADPAALDALLAQSGKAEDWSARLDPAAIPALADLDETQTATLAAYLAATMPPETHTGQMIETAGRDLRRDGRDLALEYCQSCHIITVVVTQDRSRDAWLGTMNKPSHIEVDLTSEERAALADYLVLNAGISIEDVPEDLRAGGATY
jgi:mono/diheme cytochrome c family protein